MKLQFSGHESFICKHFWLKKGYDFVMAAGSFGEESAVTGLGVGKNMVTSINFWTKAFGIIDQAGSVSEMANYLFNDKDGKDPYIENFGTLCLLHYYLVKTNKASVYSIFFNEFRKGRTEFTKDQLSTHIARILESQEVANVNANTINADINVFIRNYLKPDYKSSKADIEDDFSSLLLDLELINSYQAENASGKIVDWYRAENTNRLELPYQLVLFTILDNEAFGKSISFKDLLLASNSPGTIFLLNEDGLYQKIEQITSKYRNIVFTETAGISELQIKKPINKWNILNEYYN
jgi:hypothetical protein